MAKLPAREKVLVLCFRRVNPDEVLLVERDIQRVLRWAVPVAEVGDGERSRDVALRLASQLADGAPVADLDLGAGATYRVKAGPRAGEWTERFHAVEMAPESSAREGIWLAHYDAKARAGPESPRVRDAFSRLRELARLKP